jgi:hypothetical protein
MDNEEFKELCKSYIPDCEFKDGGTCGLMCYKGEFACTSIIVALLPRGDFAVYDQWRDVTITSDLDYVKAWLEHCSGGHKKK